MPTYQVTIQLTVEYTGALDTFDSETTAGLVASSALSVSGVPMEMSIQDRGGELVIPALNADDEESAFHEATRIAIVASQLISLQVQAQNPNQHYGHVRIAFRPRDLDVSPRDNWPAESFSMHHRTEVQTDHLSEWVDAIDQSEELAGLMASYYAALAPTSSESKFFHAFSIIEHVETHYSSYMGFRPLLGKWIERMLQGVLKLTMLLRFVDAEERERASNLLGSAIGSHRNTMESRQHKLKAILNKRFGISSIRYVTTDVTIDNKLLSAIIRRRNKLFHGSLSARKGLKRECDITILLVQSILAHLLKQDSNRTLVD